ncbi:MAG: DsbA family protein [Pseudomonadota bacterium]
MIDRLSRNPWLLGGAFVVSALLGAGIFAGVQAMTPGGTDRGRIETVVRAYILDHPEILPEAMERLQDKENAKIIAPNRAAFVTPFPGAEGGNPQGDVTVVAFLDYNCGYCRASLPTLAQLVAQDPKVRIVYREFPVLGDESLAAARWALAAAEQGKFKPFHDALYAGGQLSEAGIEAAADKVGLDKPRARKVAFSPAVERELATNHQLGRQLRVAGTPAWVIGDRVIPGVTDLASFQEAVKRARNKS